MSLEISGNEGVNTNWGAWRTTFQQRSNNTFEFLLQGHAPRTYAEQRCKDLDLGEVQRLVVHASERIHWPLVLVGQN
jgi:hypothetical protein